MALNGANRYTVLDPDIQTNTKFIRRNMNDEFSDNASDSSDEFTEISYKSKKTQNQYKHRINYLAESQSDSERWKHSSLDQESKYKTFNSFINFNGNQKKGKITLKEVKNKKKLLCNNVITSGSCCYGSKCMYAHSLEEQQIDISRKPAYDILFSSSDLSHINFHENVNLYRSLRDLTKLCDREHCTGGYNCKHGACGNKKYHVCIKDLEYGDCTNQNCECVHLTNRGLKPFYSGYALKQQDKHTKQQVPGTLLTVDFFKNQNKNDNNICDDLSTISSDTESTTSVDEYEQSIFDEVKYDEHVQITNLITPSNNSHL